MPRAITATSRTAGAQKPERSPVGGPARHVAGTSQAAIRTSMTPVALGLTRTRTRVTGRREHPRKRRRRLTSMIIHGAQVSNASIHRFEPVWSTAKQRHHRARSQRARPERGRRSIRFNSHH